MKKIFYLFVLTALITPSLFVSAQVPSKEIDELRSEVKKMRVMLEELSLRIDKLAGYEKPLPPKPVPIPCPIFERDLSLGKKDNDTGGEVSELQKYLKE